MTGRRPLGGLAIEEGQAAARAVDGERADEAARARPFELVDRVEPLAGGV